MPDSITLLLVAFLGLCLGSLATAMAWRLPRGISMLTQVRSACTSCDAPLSVRDLVPLFSYVFLHGKCRRCGAPIGLRYPVIELATLALCLGFYACFGAGLHLLPLLLLAPVLVAMTDIDLRHKIIPDGLNLAVALLAILGAAIGFVQAAYPEGYAADVVPSMLGGAVLYGLGAWLLRQVFFWRTKREALGLGDVKFFAAAGMWLGADMAQMALFLLVAGVAGIILALFWRRMTGQAAFPFGPALVMALLVLIFTGGAVFLDI